jgi:predicted protein tyrosine phosphatase
MNVLFVCTANRLRSPTAEQVFASWEGIEVDSAGLSSAAVKPLTPELVMWAQLIFVMEEIHRQKLSRRFRAYLKDQRVICLDIPDRYNFMEPALIELLNAKVAPHLRRIQSSRPSR